MKIFLTAILVLALAVGGYFFWQRLEQKQNEAAQQSDLATAVVEARDIRFAVSAAGDIGPADQVSVRPEINGKIDELPVDIGDKVKKDDLLCRLDDKELVTERDTRLAEIDGARLQLEKAERSFKRNKQLFTDNLISEEIYEDSRTDYLLASNALERGQKALRTLDERLTKTKILAPFDCTVLTRPVSLGQTVSGAAGFNSGTEIMTIANLNEMIVNAHINQADVTRLKTGQQVEIQVESVAGLRMAGVVERIAPQAVIKNNIKGFAARIQIQNIDPRIRPGMTAILNIPVASVDGVLAVPLSAVFIEKNERYVYVRKGAAYERRPVLIGISDISYAEVQQGLVEGEVVALELPPQDLTAPAAEPASKAADTSIKGVRPVRADKASKQAAL